MDIIVCLKQTFDTEAKITVKDGVILEDDVTFIVNPYDEYAIEEAVKWRDELGGTVTVVSIGKERAQEAVKTALAMGADDAIIVTSDTSLDSSASAKALYEVIKERSFDLILAGNQSVDQGASQVAVRLAEMLGIGHVSTVVQLEVSDDHVVAHRDADGTTEIVKGKLPLVITAQQGLNEPRYPSLLGIRKAAKKPIEWLSFETLVPDIANVSKAKEVEVFLPVAKESGKILQGELADQVHALIDHLHADKKVL